jgi:hypothetical protein
VKNRRAAISMRSARLLSPSGGSGSLRSRPQEWMGPAADFPGGVLHAEPSRNKILIDACLDPALRMAPPGRAMPAVTFRGGCRADVRLQGPATSFT